MANMCEFLMLVKGKTENIELFFEALTQKRHIWMGRGACAELRYETDEKDCAFIDGECKWSIQSALIDDAISINSVYGNSTSCKACYFFVLSFILLSMKITLHKKKKEKI